MICGYRLQALYRGQQVIAHEAIADKAVHSFVCAAAASRCWLAGQVLAGEHALRDR
mgnify:CR=1 FL=1